MPTSLPTTNTNGVDEVHGSSEPPTPIAEQPDSVPVSPTSPTHPNFYLPPDEKPPDGIRRTMSGTYTNAADTNAPSPTSLIPIHLVLRLRSVDFCS